MSARTVIRLGDAIRQLATLDPEATIYAVMPWTGDSLAVVEIEPDSGRPPAEIAQQGFTYFLEVFIAREVLEDWELLLATAPTEQERCDRVIYYAINDA